MTLLCRERCDEPQSTAAGTKSSSPLKPESFGNRRVLAARMDEWQLQHRYMQVEVMAELAAAASAIDPRQIPCAA